MRRWSSERTRVGVAAAVVVLGLMVVAPRGQEQWGTLAEVERNEGELNRLQPPDRVMDAVGVKPGMVVGDVGAGAGRYAVQLAARVGVAGKVYANDIDPVGLSLIRERCRKYGIGNIETIRGTVEDTGFRKASLDLVFMIYTYHHLDRPVALLRTLIPTLKPGGSVVIITGDPDKGVWTTLPRKEALARQFAEAGFDVVRTETFLPRDYLFILKPAARPSAVPDAGARSGTFTDPRDGATYRWTAHSRPVKPVESPLATPAAGRGRNRGDPGLPSVAAASEHTRPRGARS
jgi:SAM-dependent methyltransferase